MDKDRPRAPNPKSILLYMGLSCPWGRSGRYFANVDAVNQLVLRPEGVQHMISARDLKKSKRVARKLGQPRAKLNLLLDSYAPFYTTMRAWAEA